MTKLVIQKLLSLWIVFGVTSSQASSATSEAPATTQTLPSTAAACLSTWKSSCYFRSHSTKTWNSAESDCITQGGHLASISSDRENDVVLALRGKDKSKSFDVWIGLSKTTSNANSDDDDKMVDTFVWSDSMSNSYTNWTKRKGNKDCVKMLKDGKWKREDCSKKYLYVCEYRLTTPSQSPPVPAAATTKQQATKGTTSIHTTRAQKQTTTTATTTTTTAKTATSTGQITAPAAVTTTELTTAAITTQKQVTTVINTTNVPTTVRKKPTPMSISGKIISTNEPSTIAISTVSSESNLHTAKVSSNVTNSSSSYNPQSGHDDSKSSESVTLYAGVGAAITVCIAIVIVLVVWRRRKTKSLLIIAPPGSNFENRTFDSSFFRRKGRDSMEESEVYCAPNTMNNDPESGEDGYLVCKFMNEGEKSRVEFKRPSWNESEEKSVVPSTASVIFDNSEYEIPAAVPTGSQDGQQVKNLSTDRTSLALTKDEDVYWEPASTEKELYGQLENRKFRCIARCDVTDRKEIGSGEFGVVEKALWQMSKDKEILVAVKTLTSQTENDERVKFLREAAINGQFHHRNVVRLHGVVTVGSPLMIVLEYMETGDLKHYLVKQRPENSGQPSPPELPSTLLQMCRDIATGMEYLARKLFVHRDLAARNILLNEKLTCKIGDFGMARDVSDDNYYVTKGGKLPLRWCAPETWKYKKFSSASDVWSFGVLLYEIWSVGRRPFGSISNHEMMDKVECGYRLPPPPQCSRSLYHLMIDCWNPDKHDRPSFGNILQKLAASDDSLLSLGHGIEGNLGDKLDISMKCYMDLQGMYGWK